MNFLSLLRNPGVLSVSLWIELKLHYEISWVFQKVFQRVNLFYENRNLDTFLSFCLTRWDWCCNFSITGKLSTNGKRLVDIFPVLVFTKTDLLWCNLTWNESNMTCPIQCLSIRWKQINTFSYLKANCL